MNRIAFACLLGATLMSLSLRTPVAAQGTDSTPPPDLMPEIFLTWNAPFGSPRATDELRRGCSNEEGAHADTLYLSYRLRESRPELTGIEMSMYVHAQFDDTLSGAWAAVDMPRIPSWLRAEFPTGDEDGFRAGWKTTGLGFPLYFKGKTKGLVRAIYAVRADRTAPIEAGPIYTFVRFIIDRHTPEFGDCDQPLCIEWIDAIFSFGIGGATLKGELGRRCFVSVNSPQGLVCSKYRLIAERRGYLRKTPMPGDVP